MSNQSEAAEVSKTYQVICESTALVGVIKQKDKASGELVKVEEKIKEVKQPMSF